MECILFKCEFYIYMVAIILYPCILDTRMFQVFNSGVLELGQIPFTMEGNLLARVALAPSRV